MFKLMRSQAGPWILGTFIALVSVVFIFYGVFTPGNFGGSGNAGEVNGDGISINEFNRELTRRIEYYKSIFGKVTDEQLEAFHIKEAVFQDMAKQKLFLQYAKSQGFGASPEEIRTKVMTYEPFKKDGHFDKLRYKQVLEANGYSPNRFEEMIADEITEQHFRQYLANLAYVTPEEVNIELAQEKSKRKIKYVYLDNEMIRKKLPADAKPGDLNQAVEKVASALIPALTQGLDSQSNKAVKNLGASVKVSDWITAKTETLPQVGSIRQLQPDLFDSTALDPKKGGSAKRYSLSGGTLFAVLAESEEADLSKLTEKEKSDAFQKSMTRAENEVYSGLMQDWLKTAKIKPNAAIISSPPSRKI